MNCAEFVYSTAIRLCGDGGGDGDREGTNQIVELEYSK